MPLPLIPLAIAALTGGAYAASRRRKKTLKPEHKAIYEKAMQNERNPACLMQLSQAFKSQGFDDYADMLSKRAKLRGLPPETKAQRKFIFKQAMNESNPAKVEAMANAFQKEGCIGAAEALFKHAEALKQG
jgi:hypothetical protein